MPLDADEVRRGLRHLSRSDPVMRDVIRKAGPFNLRLRNDRFHSLVFSILAQQISSKAARAIREKLLARLAPRRLSPEGILELELDDLRAVGLSKQKATYILDLAKRLAAGELQLNRMGRLSDEAIIESLVQVKGIGVWTAQMFLIFSLGRLDVFPHSDFGVRSAIKNLYGLDDLPDRETSNRIAETWRPYASIGSWYCWRSLEF
jgi:DNA-3-methyladenine glycosylase II